MQVSNPNNVKIYNLSAGKSLPEWLTDRKRRTLQKTDIDIRRRIELIQDFEMPIVSNCVTVSPDLQYIYATGVYKPRLRCYDVNQLSLKFERCVDSEIVKLHVLSEDYSKFVLLQCDRYVEFHAQHGRYYRTRIPKYGRDMAYHTPSCDMYFVGASSEIYRLNLEQGRFLNSLKTNSREINCCQFNPVHHLFACGTAEGHLECWDPRSRSRVGRLDCTLNSFMQETELEGVPEVTSLRYRDGLQLAVGMSTGQVLLYDLRSDKPLLMKDHNYGLPIRNVQFHEAQGLVLSMDTRILKMWDRETGKPFTSIEPGTELNDLCVFPNSGLLFMANEAPKILSYYIPTLGPAPRWSAFLDSLTEELEENPAPSVYDDYKFITRTELESLGLAHLVGSSLLRAYMHGYFMDIRLYNKAKSIAEPFAYEEYKRNKIREKLDQERANRVKVKKLPRVNRTLAEKLMEQDEDEADQKTKKPMANPLKDDRFAKMFEDPAFQVDTESDNYRMLNPLITKMDKDRAKKAKDHAFLKERFHEVQEGASSDEGGDSGADVDDMSSDSSSDDDRAWTQEMKKQHKSIREEQKHGRVRSEAAPAPAQKPKFYELKTGANLSSAGNNEEKKRENNEEKKREKLKKRSLGERLRQDAEDSGVISQTGSGIGNMEMTFRFKRSQTEAKHRKEAEEHHKERRKVRRSAGDITKYRKVPPMLWRGKPSR